MVGKVCCCATFQKSPLSVKCGECERLCDFDGGF